MSIQGNVKAISIEKRGVLIEYDDKEEWFSVKDNVNMDYIHKGECEFRAEGEEPGKKMIFFIKGIGKAPNLSKPSTSTPEKAPYKAIQSSSEEISRMSAIKASSRVYEGTGKEDDFKRLTDEIGSYIQSGVWMIK